jgi:hypothetical protein
VTTRSISKEHLLYDIKNDFFLSLKNVGDSEIKDYIDRLFGPISKVDHIRLRANGTVEYGSLSGGKAFHSFSSIYGVPVWEFLDTLHIENYVNVTTDDTTDLTLYRSVINWFIEHDFKLEKTQSRGFAREAYHSFVRNGKITPDIHWARDFRF